MSRFFSYAALPLRLAVGGVLLRHGIVQFAAGLPATTRYLHGLGFPFASIWAVLLIVVLTIGAGCVVLGVWTRIWAAGLAIVMVLALVLVKTPVGQDFELKVVLLGSALSLVALGDGPLALGVTLKRGT